VAATAIVTGADLISLDRTFIGVPGLNLLPIEIQI
jgi:predicted nucleic acid-binding protein